MKLMYLIFIFLFYTDRELYVEISVLRSISIPTTHYISIIIKKAPQCEIYTLNSRDSFEKQYGQLHYFGWISK